MAGKLLGLPGAGPGALQSGDPHALDRQNTAGSLLSWALCRRGGSPFPQNAREWKELYEENGIWID
ncbi:MAG: hypothetical protein HFG22_19245 [Lachnospiraceae bacterium]|nr:hypothetical protein [Lachnospiraceae bacterium]